MRMMLHVVNSVKTGNAAVREGKLGPTIQRILAGLKPEAAYFTETSGSRSGYLFFDMKDASQLPAISEPWFPAFHATLTVRPAMTPQDLGGSAGAAMAAAAQAHPKTFGS
jgi:hypothetical protein